MKIKILNLLLLFFAFTSFIIINLTFLDRHYSSNPEERKVVVVKGDNLRKVASKLESEDIIFNKYFFIIAGKIIGDEGKLIPGEYKFVNGLTNTDILKILTDPNIERGYTITIPEGLTIKQIARIFSRQMGIDSAEFVRETHNDSLLNLIGVKAENLEGFLFPDTYRFNFYGAPSQEDPEGEREKEIVRTLFSQFRKKFRPEMLDTLRFKKIGMKDLITMASIVEGETRYFPEMKIIAGVYYNRLKKNMRLDADPTVQYSLPDGPKKRLTYNDLRYPSPYNTYLKKGLPPGPINNPGMNAILAALYPEKHNYLYFVAKGDGSHVFAETYEEHKKNVEQYRKYLQGTEENK